MRNADDRRYEKMLDVLGDMGIFPENIRIAEEYLEDGKEEQLDRVHTQAISLLSDEQKEKGKLFIQKLAKSDNELNIRFMHFLFAVGQASIGCLLDYNMIGWSAAKFDEARILQFLPRAKAFAAIACSWAEKERLYQNNNIFNYVEFAVKEKSTVKEAISYCDVGYINTKFTLFIIYLLAAQFKRGKLSEKEMEMLEYVRQKCVDNIDGIFGVTDGSPQHQILKAYVEESKNAVKADMLPAEVKSVLDGCTLNSYMVALFVGLTDNFCVEYPWFDNLTKACIYKDAEMVLEAVWCNAYGQNRNPVIMRVKEMGGISDYDFILWTAKKGHKPLLKKMFSKSKESYLRVLDNVSLNHSQTMMDVIKTNDPTCYRNMTEGQDSQHSKRLQKGISEELLKHFSNEQADIQKYLEGETDIAVLQAVLGNHQPAYWYPQIVFTNAVQSYYKNLGCDIFLSKVAAVIAMVKSYNYFSVFLGNNNDKDFKMLEDAIFGAADTGISPQYILDTLGAMTEMYEKRAEEAAVVVAQRYIRRETAKDHDKMLDILAAGSAVVRGMAVDYLCEVKKSCSDDETQKEDMEKCLSDLSRFFWDGSQIVKGKLIKGFGDLSGCREFISSQLASKKQAGRLMAVCIIAENKDKSFQAELQQMLEKEKSEKVAAKVREVLGIVGVGDAFGNGKGRACTDGAKGSIKGKAETPEDFVARQHKGNRKRALEWLYATPFAPVHKKDGSVADDAFMQAVLVCYSSMGVPGINKEANVLTDLLSEEELIVFAGDVFDKWMETGAPAKQKWVLYFSSIYGGIAMEEKLKKQINEWPKVSRGAMAAEAVKALALNPSPTALMAVDGISRKFKFKQVKTAAGQAMEYAAKELDISVEELSDKIVPTLGFDANMEQTFDYGNRSFKVELNNNLEIAIYDGKGKQLKNMPTPGKNDNEIKAQKANKEFKEMKKQLKNVVASQRLRLEQALSSERKWTKEAWKKLFVENPIMHCFAMGLIWGMYKDMALVTSFRYMEDGTFNTADEEELEISEDAGIGLVHPSELDVELIAAWKEQLSDYEVTQPFEQLDRTIYTHEPEEENAYEITRFEGKVINGLSLLGKMTAFGWYKGSVEDAGFYYTFYREDEALGIGAELSFEGLPVGYENEDTTIGKLKFYKAGTVKRGSYVYDTVKKENGIKIKDLPKRYFSEIIYQMTKALASAREE